jgi:hypothetical protein
MASSCASLRSVRTEMGEKRQKTYAGEKLPERVSHRAWKSGRRRRIPFFGKLYRAPTVTAFIVISTHVLPGASPKLLSNDLSRLTLLSMTCLVSVVGVAPARKWRAVS